MLVCLWPFKIRWLKQSASLPNKNFVSLCNGCPVNCDVLWTDKCEIFVITIDKINSRECTHPHSVATLDTDAVTGHFFRRHQFGQTLERLQTGRDLVDIRNAGGVNHSETNPELLHCHHLLRSSRQCRLCEDDSLGFHFLSFCNSRDLLCVLLLSIL